MNNLYKIIIGVFVGFCACFMSNGEVDAGFPTNEIKTENGYAVCTYGVNDADGSPDIGWETLLAYQVKAWAWVTSTGKLTTGVEAFYFDDGNSKDTTLCTVKNGKLQRDNCNKVPLAITKYDNHHRDDKKMKKSFYVNSKWTCPNKIYLVTQQWAGFGTMYSGILDDNFDDLPWINFVSFNTRDKASAESYSGSGQSPLYIELPLVNKSVKNSFGAVVNGKADEGVLTGGNVDGSDTTIDQQEEINKAAEEQMATDLPSVQDIKDYWSNATNSSNYSNDSGNCNLIDDDLKNLLNTIFTWVSIGGIILVVIMTCISGIKVITGTEDAIKDFAKGLKVRIICLVVLLLAPVIVNFAIQTVNGIGNIAGVNQDDPLCGVGK